LYVVRELKEFDVKQSMNCDELTTELR
jgi:hypothetical protein